MKIIYVNSKPNYREEIEINVKYNLNNKNNLILKFNCNEKYYDNVINIFKELDGE